MLRAPPTDRSINKRHIQKREYSEQRAQQRAAFRLLNQRSQQQISDVQQPQHKSRSQPRVPRPPDPPRRMRPDRPGHQIHGAEHQANLGRRNRQRITLRAAPKHIRDVRAKTNEERRKHSQSASRVEIENPLHQTHGALFRRNVERRVGRASYQRQDCGPANQPAPHARFIPPKDIRRKSTAPSKTPHRTPPGIRHLSIAQTAACPAARPSPPCWPPTPASAAATTAAAASIRACVLARKSRKAPSPRSPRQDCPGKTPAPVARIPPVPECCTKSRKSAAATIPSTAGTVCSPPAWPEILQTDR